MKYTRIVKLISLLSVIVSLLGITIPALADYLGPDRTRTESHVETYDWGVWAKPDPTGNSCNHTYGTDCVVCTWERDPGSPCGDATYWYKVGTRSEVVERTITYPEATISGTLNGCNARNGWCSTTPALSLSASEPVTGYAITLIEGTRNGEIFACNGSSCEIPLLEGENTFTFWALSNRGDSSRMGSLAARVDTQPPQVDGNLSGTAGEAGWYVSPVTFFASASDPEPGSGIEALSYSLDGGGWTAYAAPLEVQDGLHSITFRAQDLAGHVTEISQSVQVDTLPPQVSDALTGEQVNGWYLSQVTFTASASDNGSGLACIEYALDGSSWQSYNAPVTIGDGIHTLRVRAFDAAGNVTEHAPLTFQVDGTPPRIRLSDSWHIWESGELKVNDGQSGLSGVEIEIRDPQGRWRKVSYSYEPNGQSFTTNITWDRRFADGTLAPIGTYQVVVKASDRAGNFTQETASIHILAPNAPTYTPAPTRTALPTPTHLPPLTPDTSHLTSETVTAIPSRTPDVSAFGAFPTPILDHQSPVPQPANSQSSVLWGAAAIAAIGAATAYALEQRRKRKEEEARQRAEAAAEVARRNAAEEARKVQNWLIGQQIKKAEEEALKKAQERGKTASGYAAKESELENMNKHNTPLPSSFISSSRFHKPLNKELPDGIIIPPLNTDQYVGLKNWNVAAQVASYGITAMIGAFVGIKFTGNPLFGAVGAIVGVMWGAYEANCIASVQEQFDQAYQQSGSVRVWREGWTFNVHGGGATYTVANAPLSAAYVATTTFFLTGKLP